MNPKEYEDEIKEIVGRIDKLRVEYGYSIYELAQRAGVSINTIKYVYRKNSLPSLQTIFRISEAFDIPVWQLFYCNENGLFFSKSEITLVKNYENLPEQCRKILLDVSEHLK